MTTAWFGPAEAAPILVTGMARSGTTWVGRMLEASGRVGFISEPFNLPGPPGRLRLPVGHLYRYTTEENEGRILPHLLAMLRFRYPLWQELRRCRGPADLARTLRSWRDFARYRHRRPLLKAPHAVLSAEWFARRLSGRVVVTVRHPAAVVSSWARLDWDFDLAHLLEQPELMRDRLGPLRSRIEAARAPDKDALERVALLWHVIYSAVDEYRRRHPAFMVIRQEDLARDPLGGFADLYRSLDLPFTDEAAAAIRASSGGENPAEARAASPYETRLDSRASAERWKGRLTDEELGRIRSITGEVARAFYPESE